MTIDQQLDDILKKYSWTDEDDALYLSGNYAKLALKEAYILGRSSKKCNDDKDNPYHIDYERQTKLDL